MSSEINPSTDSNMDELIKQVKKTIKEHKNSKFRMDEKMYGSIYTSSSHWGLPLSERLWNSWLKHTEMHPLTSKISYEIDYEKIVAFCKARNAITHRGENDNFDEDIAKTAFVLMGLTYCYTLSRIGFTTDEITDIMKKTKIIY